MTDLLDGMPERMECLCLFCNSPLTAPEDAEFQSGDMIKCEKCGNMNDWDSVFAATEERALEATQKAVQKNLDKFAKNLFK